MTGQMNRGEDIEHYADTYEKRQEVQARARLRDNDTVNVTESDGNWVEALGLGYTAKAKIYPEASHRGIQGEVTDGHISKLEIRNDKGEILYNYDRGLDFALADAEILASFLVALENYAKNELDV